jgi:hypothetical protein
VVALILIKVIFLLDFFSIWRYTYLKSNNSTSWLQFMSFTLDNPLYYTVKLYWPSNLTTAFNEETFIIETAQCRTHFECKNSSSWQKLETFICTYSWFSFCPIWTVFMRAVSIMNVSSLKAVVRLLGQYNLTLKLLLENINDFSANILTNSKNTNITNLN